MKKLNVPLVKQTKMTCGPTALRMVLLYLGYDVSRPQIIKGIGGIKSFGVRTIALAKFARELGFRVTCYAYNKELAKDQATIRKPSTKLIKQFLKRKLPVIIAVRSFILRKKTKATKMGHFIVMTGYQDGVFYYNDPKDGKRHKIQEEDLQFAWFANIANSSGYLLVIDEWR